MWCGVCIRWPYAFSAFECTLDIGHMWLIPLAVGGKNRHKFGGGGKRGPEVCMRVFLFVYVHVCMCTFVFARAFSLHVCVRVSSLS